jgi:GT2 family glycosyltransferase
VEKLLTVVIPIIRLDMIERCLETFYANTDNIFYVIVIDQSIQGMDMSLREKYKNLMIIRSPKTDVHYTGNLGFTQATNLGLSLAQTPYVMFLNDDCEMIHPGWWDGVIETFNQVEAATPERPPMLVNVASVKLPDWSVNRPKGEDFYILPYKQEYTDEDWNFLVNEEHYVNDQLTIKPGSVIDGINLYASVAITKRLLEVGLLDEFWYPGGADDYDLCCRASMYGYRCVGTTKSWAFHHWSKSFEDVESKAILVQDELRHGSLEEKWGYKTDKNGQIMTYPAGHEREGEKISRFDMWGITCMECDSILHLDARSDNIAICPKHPDETYKVPDTVIMPL